MKIEKPWLKEPESKKLSPVQKIWKPRVDFPEKFEKFIKIKDSSLDYVEKIPQKKSKKVINRVKSKSIPSEEEEKPETSKWVTKKWQIDPKNSKPKRH